MPTPAMFDLPPPTSWEEFENIVADVATRRWKTPHVYRYGRQGQKQDGVDIICQPPHLAGAYAGIQCKATSELRFDVVQAAIDEAKAFVPRLQELTIATSAARNARVHEKVRRTTWPFNVQLMFWGDIALAVAEFDELLVKYYPSVARRTTTVADIERLILEVPTAEFDVDAQSGAITCGRDVMLQIFEVQGRVDQEFREPWVRSFFANRYEPATKQLVEIRYSGSLMRTEYFVAVDGFRHLIPMPRTASDLTITLFQYRLARILSVNRIYDLDSALKRCGIMVRADV